MAARTPAGQPEGHVVAPGEGKGHAQSPLPGLDHDKLCRGTQVTREKKKSPTQVGKTVEELRVHRQEERPGDSPLPTE